MIWLPFLISPADALTRSSARTADDRDSSSAFSSLAFAVSAATTLAFNDFINSSLSTSCASSHSTRIPLDWLLLSFSFKPLSRSLFAARSDLSSARACSSAASALCARLDASLSLLSRLYFSSISSRARASSSLFRLVSESIEVLKPNSLALRSPSMRVFVFSSSSSACRLSFAASSSSRACAVFSASFAASFCVSASPDAAATSARASFSSSEASP
mmetsp:Transcript_10090/g.37394  ORF Transcript_10090/g.37394 Transcript_10090/m.37394 type:complete len:217 (+) Transcript_10090:591-1241(+)